LLATERYYRNILPKDFAGLKEQLNKHATYRLGKPGRPFPKTRRLVVEVIIWPLDKSEVTQSVETDANGWPIGFFDETVGAWAGEPLER